MKAEKRKKKEENDKYEGTAPWVRTAEFKLDRYNHLMEFLRTFLGFCTLTLQIIILLKLFDFI